MDCEEIDYEADIEAKNEPTKDSRKGLWERQSAKKNRACSDYFNQKEIKS
jgi:hypothetical protein